VRSVREDFWAKRGGRKRSERMVKRTVNLHILFMAYPGTLQYVRRSGILSGSFTIESFSGIEIFDWMIAQFSGWFRG
jgi:hypothetical protein